MENREWLNEYVLLKQVNANNPFSVPDGYFNGLSEHIMSAIKIDELKSKMPLDGFVVPENYFEELNNNIQSRVNIEQILSTENTSFTVPENYFDELRNNIQSRVNIESVLNTEDAGFTVPENYFEELNTQITSRIFVKEALTASAETLAVPENYFNTLNSKILNKTVNQPAVKRKGAVVRFLSSTAFKYATAACLTIMVGTGVLLRTAFSPKAVHDRSYLHKQLSKVPVDELQEYLQLNAESTTATDDPDLENAVQSNTNGIQN